MARWLKKFNRSFLPPQAPSFNRQIDPNTEIVVTSGANEGIYAIETAFLEPGDEVIMFEPFFDQVSWNVTTMPPI